MKKICLICLCFIICFSMVACKKPKTQEIAYEYQTKEITINSNGYALLGEIVYPVTDNKTPAVIIVGGSGNVNMNGIAGNQTPYKDIAYKLSQKGIASIRCNKVNYQHTSSVVVDYDFTIKDEYDYMIKSMIDYLKADDKINHQKIYLLGHSLGAQIIPKFLNEDKSLAGGIIMAGTTMHLLDLLLEQAKAQSEELYQTYLPYCNDLKTLTAVR